MKTAESVKAGVLYWPRASLSVFLKPGQPIPLADGQLTDPPAATRPLGGTMHTIHTNFRLSFYKIGFLVLCAAMHILTTSQLTARIKQTTKSINFLFY